MAKQSIAQRTQHEINAHPSVREALGLGLINYSSLARFIGKRIRVHDVATIAAACRRYQPQLQKRSRSTEEVDRIIAEARLLIRTNLIICIFDRPKGYDTLYAFENKVRKQKGTVHLIDGEESCAIVTGKEFKAEAKRCFQAHLQEVVEDLVQLSFILPVRARRTAGVAARLYAKLASEGINVVAELTSCGDHLIIISEKDLSKALARIRPE